MRDWNIANGPAIPPNATLLQLFQSLMRDWNKSDKLNEAIDAVIAIISKPYEGLKQDIFPYSRRD